MTDAPQDSFDIAAEKGPSDNDQRHRLVVSGTFVDGRERSILSGVEDNAEDPDIKYIRFIDYAGTSSGQVFEDAEMRDFFTLTVVKPEGSAWWLVWGLSDSYFPARDEVRDI